MTHIVVRRILDRLQSRYWFTPLMMAVLAFFAAQALLLIDAAIPDAALNESRILYSGNPAEARTTLLALAGTILATAGVVYSLLTLPMSIAVSQYGSRLLRLFLRDRTTQLVLGMFVGAFVFCLSVALAIPHESAFPTTPQLSTTAGLLLSLATFGSLIVLIHHIATSLQAPNLVALAGSELQSVIHATEQMAPVAPANSVSSDGTPAAWRMDEREATTVYSDTTGYVQAIDAEALMALAVKHDLFIRITHKPGKFARPWDALAQAWPARHTDHPIARRIRDCFELGNLRTPTQDVEYAINQLVEVALRAMSAAINDPFTAMTCLDHLGVGLRSYIDHHSRPSRVVDAEGRVRLMFEPAHFPELLEAAFNMLRRASRENPDVLVSMLSVLDAICRKPLTPDECAAVLQQVDLIEAESEASTVIEFDKARVRRRCDALRAVLHESIASQ
jgi:uncharacterized membrane protein